MRMTDIEKECLAKGLTKTELQQEVESFIRWCETTYARVGDQGVITRLVDETHRLRKAITYKAPPMFRPLVPFMQERFRKVWYANGYELYEQCRKHPKETVEAWRAMKKLLVVAQFID